MNLKLVELRMVLSLVESFLWEGMREPSGVPKIFSLDLGGSDTFVYACKNPSNCTLKLVHFTVCESYHNLKVFESLNRALKIHEKQKKNHSIS